MHISDMCLASRCTCLQVKGSLPGRVHFVWASRNPREFCILDAELLEAARWEASCYAPGCSQLAVFTVQVSAEKLAPAENLGGINVYTAAAASLLPAALR
jgi:hypothetical protein